METTEYGVSGEKQYYQCPVLKIRISWKLGASAHVPSGISTSTRKPSLYPSDSNVPPLASADHLHEIGVKQASITCKLKQCSRREKKKYSKTQNQQIQNQCSKVKMNPTKHHQ